MTATQTHLFITHLPVFASVIGVLIVLIAHLRRSRDAKIAGYGILIVSALGAALAYLTGEKAEHYLEEIPGITINKESLEAHEDAAIFPLVFLSITGVLSLLGIFLELRAHRLARYAAVAVIVFGLFSFTTALQTASHGGKIRHTEITDGGDHLDT